MSEELKHLAAAYGAAMQSGDMEAKITAAAALDTAINALAASGVAAPATPVDWTEPTTHVQRIADVMQALCAGQRPSDEIVSAWLSSPDEARLQEFAIEHGPAWAQGIAVIDAARLLAEQPTEGVDHEFSTPSQPVAAEATAEVVHTSEAMAEALVRGMSHCFVNREAAPRIAEILRIALAAPVEVQGCADRPFLAGRPAPAAAYEYTHTRNGEVVLDTAPPAEEDLRFFTVRPLVYGDSRPAAPLSEVPDGFRLMPDELSPEMLRQGWLAVAGVLDHPALRFLYDAFKRAALRPTPSNERG